MVVKVIRQIAGFMGVRDGGTLAEGMGSKRFRSSHLSLITCRMWAAGYRNGTLGDGRPNLGRRAQEPGSSFPSDTTLLLFLAFDGPVHHFNLGRRIPGFDYGPDGFGTGLTPLHLSDDGEGGTFHFHDPPPPYTAYKYPDIDQPDDPPPPYEASINPDSVFYDPAGAYPLQEEGIWSCQIIGH